MDEYVYNEIVVYLKSLNYSEKESKEIANDYTCGIADALEIQLDVELNVLRENLKG